ncbi:MAG: Holliday junction resolvase RuvX [Polyangiaceae bacterium]|nr:Holliday junction resolvase RuvX [Polyangiaceae bacterium]
MARNQQGRVLAVDFGRVRVGLALCDELRVVARPFKILDGTDKLRVSLEIAKICKDEEVSHVIVGLPLHMSGEMSASARKATELAKRIADASGLEVELVDERLTSVEAERIRQEVSGGRAKKPGPKGKPAPIDDLAAAVLLQAWLDGH